MVGLAIFVFIAFKPVGNVAEFSRLNALSWLGHRVDKMPIVIAIALLAIFFYDKIFATNARIIRWLMWTQTIKLKIIWLI